MTQLDLPLLLKKRPRQNQRHTRKRLEEEVLDGDMSPFGVECPRCGAGMDTQCRENGRLLGGHHLKRLRRALTEKL